MLLALVVSWPLALPGAPPNTPRSRLEVIAADRRLVTIKEIYLLAIALESYAVDHNAYPVPASAPTPSSSLTPFLAPTYLTAVPTRDPWCSDYLYWSNGTDYFIVGYSSDASSDFSYSSLVKGGYAEAHTTACTGSSELPGADLVFADGIFCRWYGEKPTDPFH
jgi:hypothetical protein